MSSSDPETSKTKESLPTSAERVDETKRVPPDQQSVIVKAEFSEYSGPLPSPQILREYEEVLPGAAERIFSVFESENSHRHEIENQLVKAESAIRSLKGSFDCFSADTS